MRSDQKHDSNSTPTSEIDELFIKNIKHLTSEVQLLMSTIENEFKRINAAIDSLASNQANNNFLKTCKENFSLFRKIEDDHLECNRHQTPELLEAYKKKFALVPYKG